MDGMERDQRPNSNLGRQRTKDAAADNDEWQKSIPSFTALRTRSNCRLSSTSTEHAKRDAQAISIGSHTPHFTSVLCQLIHSPLPHSSHYPLILTNIPFASHSISRIILPFHLKYEPKRLRCLSSFGNMRNAWEWQNWNGILVRLC